MNRLFVFCFGMLLFIGCSNEPQSNEVYSVLHDITDPLSAQPNADNFLDAIDVSNTQKHIKLRYRIISDIDFNPVSELSRPATKTGLFSNAIDEKRKGKAFESECRALLAEKDPIEGETHSSIFLPIVRELNYLASLPNSDTKHLIIYTDLRENCDWFSYYTYRDLMQLQQQPDKVFQRYLDQVNDIPKIENCKVHIIYVPEDHDQNVQYKYLQRLYAQIFEQWNISIVFSARLTKAELQL